MTKEEKVDVGSLIAHWRRRLSVDDVAEVRDIIKDAVKKCGLKCFVKVANKPNYYSDIGLGYDKIFATIKLRNPCEAVRTARKDLVKMLSTIKIDFDKCAGLFSFEDHGKRHKEQDALFEQLPKADAMAAIDALPWDAESVHFNGSTDGKIRQYRRRQFYRYEGKNHYDYASRWEGLRESVAEYISGIAHECKLV